MRRNSSCSDFAWPPVGGVTLVLASASAWIRSIARAVHSLTLAATVCAGFCARSAEIQVLAPADGGTPRDPARIERVGPAEFRIRATVEEGRSPLRHAVSRVDLICRNQGTEPATVTVQLDLSEDGKRTDFTTKPEGGMPTRDFVFIQPPGGPWQQINGTTEGWLAKVRIPAVPGETKIGLAPWYTFADHERFIASLPDHAHLRKEILGRSDGGRAHWELIITDPEITADKQTLYWHAREHAYETFSSFAMEGLVEFLLSDEAAEFRRRYVFALHPMTNVDGVAQGHEYRGGYDFPDPRGTATARMTFATIDRLRPDFAVAWHNWTAPRDQDVVFYTDGENGAPSARAWHLFTQRFPSPRSAGHRWRDDSPPEKYSWFKRQPLSEANVHQYAMKRLGTRVWGWEMPWWNRTTDDARHAGAAFGRAFLATLDDLARDAKLPQAEAAPVEVPRWEIHEFVLHGRAHVANPFRDAALVGEFTAPSGKKITAAGFFDGDDTWRLRFAPDEPGEWRYLLRGEGVPLFQRGTLRCTAPRRHGFIRPHPQNPYAFAYSDGTPFFPMGDTCYGLHDDSPITAELRAGYLRTRRAQRFNFVRMHVRSSTPRAQKEPVYWPWGGTPQQPDIDRLNPAYFRSLDAVMRELRAADMNVELILLNLYRPPMTLVDQWTPARERFWLRYVLARYGAFDHLFLWTIANEYENHPDGRYRLDREEDVAWARRTAGHIKASDPHGHLVTVHPVFSASARGTSTRDSWEPPFRIGEFFGDAPGIDVLTHQTSLVPGNAIKWDDALKCWTGDDPHLVASIHADRRFNKPVLNTENGYEYFPGGPTERRQVHRTDKVRRAGWRIVCAGGYFAAGFVGTIGHSDTFNLLDAPNRYTFTIRDAGAAGQLGKLHEFFSALPFWRMHPFGGVTGNDAAVAIAEPGNVYVVYLPHGGSVTIDLTGVPASTALAARWFNPRTGEFESGFELARGAHRTVSAPDSADWALQISAK